MKGNEKKPVGRGKLEAWSLVGVAFLRHESLVTFLLPRDDGIMRKTATISGKDAQAVSCAQDEFSALYTVFIMINVL